MGMVVLVILAFIGLVILVAVLRLLWRTARGDIQIEPTSHGRQFFGRSKNEPR
jgi:hypothetical protein